VPATAVIPDSPTHPEHVPAAIPRRIRSGAPCYEATSPSDTCRGYPQWSPAHQKYRRHALDQDLDVDPHLELDGDVEVDPIVDVDLDPRSTIARRALRDRDRKVDVQGQRWSRRLRCRLERIAGYEAIAEAAGLAAQCDEACGESLAELSVM